MAGTTSVAVGDGKPNLLKPVSVRQRAATRHMRGRNRASNRGSARRGEYVGRWRTARHREFLTPESR